MLNQIIYCSVLYHEKKNFWFKFLHKFLLKFSTLSNSHGLFLFYRFFFVQLQLFKQVFDYS